MRKEKTVRMSYFFEEEEFKDKLGFGCDNILCITLLNNGNIQIDVTESYNMEEVREVLK